MCIRDRTYSMLFGMSRRAASIVLTPEEGSTLERWSRARSIPARLVLRARIVRLAAQGRQSQDIAEELDISRPTVQLWRQRFLALRLAGLEKDAPRPGRLAAYLSTKSAAGGGAVSYTHLRAHE